MASGATFATLRDLLDRLATSQDPAVVPPDRATDYSGAVLAAEVRKAANLVHHYGVGRNRALSVVVGPRDPGPAGKPGWLGGTADPLFALLGGLALGAPVDTDPDPPIDTAALVAPTAWLDRFPTRPGTDTLAYGARPSDPAIAHFERERWSENAVPPPEPITADTPALRHGDTVYTHGDLCQAVDRIRDADAIASATHVRLATAIDRPAALVAGVLTPLASGTPIRPVPLPAAGDRPGVIVVSEDSERRLDLTAVLAPVDRPAPADPDAEP